MTEPFALLPLAVAAAGGRVDGHEAARLAAAGLTLLQRSAPLVRALRGRRAAILLPTGPQFFVALAAAEGRAAVLVNPLAAPPEVAFQIADAGVGAVFTIAALAGKVPDDTPRVLLDDAPRTARVVAAGAAADVELGAHFGLPLAGHPDAEGRDEEAAIVYTSAMAGRPLGAILTHRNLLANARSTVAAAAFTPGDRVLALLPFSHLFGLTVTGTAPLLAGARVATLERFNPVRALEIMHADAITAVVGVPAVYHALLSAHQRRGGGRLEALRLCICGGAPLATALQDAWADATGAELRQGYGLTEAGPVCLFNPVDQPNRRGRLGVPFPGVEVAIRALDHERLTFLRPGAEGEICVRGANVFRGYVGEPPGGPTAGLAVRDGWLLTGDCGVADDAGAVTFTGVRKAMFTRNGFNIYPREIERVVGEMPGVRAVTAYPIPEPTREHDIGLRVTGGVTAEAVRAWCEAGLSAYKQPSVIDLAD